MSGTTVLRTGRRITDPTVSYEIFSWRDLELCNSYTSTMVCPPVHGDNPRAIAS